MLTIYCGDNIIDSRKSFLAHKDRLKAENCECIDVSVTEIANLETKALSSASLFAEKRAFMCENVLSRKPQRETIATLSDNQDIEIVIWEGSMDDRSLKRYFPKARLIVSKLPTNLWKFLDSIYPGNAKYLITQMSILVESVDENMLLYMLQRRVKDLYIVGHGVDGKRKLAPWQANILKGQAARWGSSLPDRDKNLLRMNSKLFAIEKGVKSGTMPYSIQKALDILFSFYLQ